eukprot:TRINITY_DN2047_c2_g1_i1.p1 TRINITY_DN2047_c2_g1~~TRINITY_DN2047_c2_g1_i1.p1  ORF type:complete len:4005 (+),score=760.52 TRINITY_DN2047_c2_g1_i1:105-12119(+)
MPEWEIDGPNCAHCKSRFSLLNSKHHCRKCRNVFCGKCSGRRINLGGKHRERVCDECFTKVIEEREKESDFQLPDLPAAQLAADPTDLVKKIMAEKQSDFNVNAVIHRRCYADLLAAEAVEFRPKRSEYERDILADNTVDRYQESAEKFAEETMYSLGIRARVETTLQAITQGIKNSDDNHIQYFRRCVESALGFTQSLPNPGSVSESELSTKLFHSISYLRARIDEIVIGEGLMVPIFWSKQTPSEDDPDDKGHAVFLLLHRASTDSFHVAVVNLGEGEGYHPYNVDGTSISAGQYQRIQPYVTIKASTLERVRNGWFWYFALEQLYEPHEDNGPEFIYEVLLPYLVQEPPSHASVATGTGSHWVNKGHGGDISFGRSVLLGGKWLVASSDKYSKVSESLDATFRLAVVEGQLSQNREFTCSEIEVLLIGIKTAARHALVDCTPEFRRRLEVAHNKITTMNPTTRSATAIAARPRPPLLQSLELPAGDDKAFLFRGVNVMDLATYTDLEKLAGKKIQPRMLLPFNTVEIKDSVETPADCLLAFKSAIDAIGLLFAQSTEIPNYTQMIFMLIAHLFTRVIPVPLPLNVSRDKCFWRRQDFRYETQQTLLQQLDSLSRSFTAVSLTQREKRDLDCRIIVSYAIQTLTDCIGRICATDTPSLLSLHFSGNVPICKGSKHMAPVLPYCLAHDEFVKKTDDIILFWPEMTNTRTLILDYWKYMESYIQRDHVIFGFRDCNVTEAEHRFINQLSLASGHGAIGGKDMLQALVGSGSQAWLVAVCPEFACLRDITFRTLMLFSHLQNSLPSANKYLNTHAFLTWKAQRVQHKSENPHKVQVTGFGGVDLGPCMASPQVHAKKNIVSKLYDKVVGKVRLRNESPSSMAVLLGKDVKDEEDVLFCEKLPDFKQTLTGHQRELLFSFPTAPTVLIPLLMPFLASHEKIQCLADDQVQLLLDAALFEPGPWRQDMEITETEVPAATREHLSTPAGRLMYELSNSNVVLDTCISMLTIALEKDSGRHSSPSAAVLLCATRVVSRILRYLNMLIDSLELGTTDNKFCRGIRAPELGVGISLDGLKEKKRMILSLLTTSVFNKLLSWIELDDLAEKDTQKASKIFAHIVLIFEGYTEQDYIDSHEEGLGFESPICAMITSQVYLSTYHEWGKGELGASELEVSDIFEKSRRVLFRLFTNNELIRNIALSVSKRIVTSGLINEEPEEGSDTPSISTWVSSVSVPGAFFDVMANQTEESLIPRPEETYGMWLHRITSADNCISINMNNGVFSHKKQDIGKLPSWVREFPDYVDYFGKVMLKSARLGTTTERERFRLLGLDGDYDIHAWSADVSGTESALKRVKVTGTDLENASTWVRNRIVQESITIPMLASTAMDLRVIFENEKRAHLAGVHPESDKPIYVELLRSPPVLSMHQLIECGRRFFKRQIYTTDAVSSFYSPHQGTGALASGSSQRYSRQGNEWTLAAGSHDDDFTTERSVQIFKTVDGVRRMLLPSRLLVGIIPLALLEQFTFWEDQGGDEGLGLSNKNLGLITAVSKTDDATMEIRITDSKARVNRTTVKLDGTKETLQLVNLMASGTDVAESFANLFSRLENMSHVLVWCTIPSSGDEVPLVKRIELPRLRLTFTQTNNVLACDQHTGYYLNTTELDTSTLKLTDSFSGGSIVLSKATGELAILTSSTAEPLRPKSASVTSEPLSWVERHMPSQLLFRRHEDKWVAGLSSEARHHIYFIHSCHSLLKAPAVSSNLYLLLCLALTRKYVQVAEMASRLGEVSGKEECRLFKGVIDTLLEARENPDAAACRIRMGTSITQHCSSVSFERINPAWSEANDIKVYSLSRSLVNSAIAISAEDECRLLLKHADKLPLDCRNRAKALRTIIDGTEAFTPEYPKTMLRKGSQTPYDSLKIEPSLDLSTCISAISTLKVLPKKSDNSDPRMRTGVTAIAAMGQIKARGYLNPLFVYEVYKSTIQLKVYNDDSCVALGSLLTRYMYHKRNFGGKEFLHALDQLIPTDQDRRQLPDLPTDEEIKEAIEQEQKNRGVIKKLFHSVTDPSKMRIEALDKAVKKLKAIYKERPPTFQQYHEHLPPTPISAKGAAMWKASSYITDVSSAAVSCDIKLAEYPLRELAVDFTHAKEPEPLASWLTAFKGIVEKEGLGSHVEQSLENVIQRGGKESMVFTTSRPTEQSIQSLLKAIAREKSDTKRDVVSYEKSIMDTFNPEDDTVGRIAQTTQSYNIASIIRLYLSSQKGVENYPDNLWEAVTMWLVLQSKLTQLQACELQALSVSSLLASGSSATVQLETLANLLSAQRYHVSKATDSKPGSIDPRMLVFEFATSIILRKPQVELLENLIESTTRGTAKVKQLIMGQGKTTVITPLLSLILADQQTLIMVCMPKSLIDFSRSVLLDVFSSPVIPRPILTLEFQRSHEITESLYDRLVSAKESRGIVLMHPTTVKSMLLKIVLCLNSLLSDKYRLKEEVAEYNAASIGTKIVTQVSKFVGVGEDAGMATQNKKSLEREIHFGRKIYKMFRMESVLLMDEIDLLMHPLKSELNWPLGIRFPLDLTEKTTLDGFGGFRFKLPWFLLDLVFSVSGSSKSKIHELSNNGPIQKTLGELKEVFEEGIQTSKLTIVPHLTLLNEQYYKDKIAPLLRKCTAAWLHAYVHLKKSDIEEFLINGYMETLQSDKESKALNLSLDWIDSFLPHILQKIHRQSFGYLTEAELTKSLNEHPDMPKSRIHLAVPFIGKDTPSPSSEFQHPDITIGFTIHAYKQNGMRMSDLRIMIDKMKKMFYKDETYPRHARKISLEYVSCMKEMSCRVNGYDWKGNYIEPKNRGKHIDQDDVKVDYPETAREARQRREMWHLQVLNVNDTNQMNVVSKYLLRSDRAVKWFLFEYAFPTTLLKSARQLSASGQELGNAIISGRRAGFSGTPQDLLPLAMGNCDYAPFDDGDMISTLGNSDVVSVRDIDSRDPMTVLKLVADAPPKYTALIDTGALITGMSNKEVADYLMKQQSMIDKFHGVVYLDEDDRRMVRLRNGKCILFGQCGLADSQRFTFYDHIHTTGMDIKQSIVCTAFLTISPSMVFRDYAQGSYRMRGLGKGQTLEILVPPESKDVCNEHVPLSQKSSLELTRQLQIVQWMLLKESEAVNHQKSILDKQCIDNLWREAAYDTVLDPTVEAQDHDSTLEILRQTIETTIRNTVKKRPKSDGIGVDTVAKQYADNKERFGELEESKKEIATSIRVKSQARSKKATHHALGLEGEETHMSGEAEDEQEVEQEQEQEDEQEQEQEISKEADVIEDQCGNLNLKRSRYEPLRWEVNQLENNPSLMTQFFASFKEYAPPARKDIEPLSFPEFMYYSNNWMRLPNSNLQRRHKNIIAYLDVFPQPDDSSIIKTGSGLSDIHVRQLETSFKLFSRTSETGSLTWEQTSSLLDTMNLGLNDYTKDRVRERMEKAAGDSWNKEQITYKQIIDGLSSMEIYQLHTGRYSIVISLDELEHFRSLINKVNHIPIAIRIPHYRGTLDDTILQCTEAYLKLKIFGSHQSEAVESCLQFADCIPNMTQTSLSWVLRLIRESPTVRKDFWKAQRLLKRRTVKSWIEQSVSVVLTEEAEYGKLQAKTVRERVKIAMLNRGWGPEATFTKLDRSETGALSLVEFEMGLKFLDVGRTLSQAAWHDAVRCVFVDINPDLRDRVDNIHVRKEEFVDYFKVTDEDKERLRANPLPEFWDDDEMDVPEEVPVTQLEGGFAPLDRSRLTPRHRFKIQAKHLSAFTPIWNSVKSDAGSQDGHLMSVWAADPGPQNLRYRFVIFGDYIRNGLTMPVHKEKGMDIDRKNIKLPCKAWLITDLDLYPWAQTATLDSWIESRFPKPVEYHLVWSLKVAEPVYVWEPIAPKGFVKGGLVATTTPEQPSKDAPYRCLPENWATWDVSEHPRMPIWKESWMGSNQVVFSIDTACGLFSIERPPVKYYTQTMAIPNMSMLITNMQAYEEQDEKQETYPGRDVCYTTLTGGQVAC